MLSDPENAMEDCLLTDLLTYDCPVTGKKRTAGYGSPPHLKQLHCKWGRTGYISNNFRGALVYDGMMHALLTLGDPNKWWSRKMSSWSTLTGTVK